MPWAPQMELSVPSLIPENRKGRSLWPSRRHIRPVPVPGKRQQILIFKLMLSRLVLKHSEIGHHTINQSALSLPQQQGLLPIVTFLPLFLQPQALWTFSLFLNIYPNLGRPLRSTSSSSTEAINSPPVTQTHKTLSSLNSDSNYHHTDTKTFPPCCSLGTFISTNGR